VEKIVAPRAPAIETPKAVMGAGRFNAHIEGNADGRHDEISGTRAGSNGENHAARDGSRRSKMGVSLKQ